LATITGKLAEEKAPVVGFASPLYSDPLDFGFFLVSSRAAWE